MGFGLVFVAFEFELVDSLPEIDHELGHLLTLHLITVEIPHRLEQEGRLLQLFLHQIYLTASLHVEGQKILIRFIFWIVLGQFDALLEHFALLFKVVVVVSEYAERHDVLGFVL